MANLFTQSTAQRCPERFFLRVFLQEKLMAKLAYSFEVKSGNLDQVCSGLMKKKSAQSPAF